jgi:hypothetical protein
MNDSHEKARRDWRQAETRAGGRRPTDRRVMVRWHASPGATCERLGAPS